MARYIFITGGVVSSLGKGLASAALGALLQARGYTVRVWNRDPAKAAGLIKLSAAYPDRLVTLKLDMLSATSVAVRPLHCLMSEPHILTSCCLCRLQPPSSRNTRRLLPTSSSTLGSSLGREKFRISLPRICSRT